MMDFIENGGCRAIDGEKNNVKSATHTHSRFEVKLKDGCDNEQLEVLRSILAPQNLPNARSLYSSNTNEPMLPFKIN